MEMGYVYRAYPNVKQRELIKKTFGCKRFVYNYFLNVRKTRWENEKKNMKFFEMNKLLTLLKQEKDFLCEPDKCALQNAIREVARMHAKIVAQRKDYLHKLTNFVTKKYGVIFIEDLNISEMMKNHCFARHIMDSSWGELRRQLEYKSLWRGRVLLTVDRFYASSQTCGNCGFKNHAVKDLNVREWVCPKCGYYHSRDLNAAQNILCEGLRLLVELDEKFHDKSS